MQVSASCFTKIGKYGQFRAYDTSNTTATYPVPHETQTPSNTAAANYVLEYFTEELQVML